MKEIIRQNKCYEVITAIFISYTVCFLTFVIVCIFIRSLTSFVILPLPILCGIVLMFKTIETKLNRLTNDYLIEKLTYVLKFNSIDYKVHEYRIDILSCIPEETNSSIRSVYFHYQNLFRENCIHVLTEVSVTQNDNTIISKGQVKN